MPVPKRKRSRARRDSRFANKGLKVNCGVKCPSCASPCLPHAVCKECGHYKGIKVLTTKKERELKRGEVKKVQAERSSAREKHADADTNKED